MKKRLLVSSGTILMLGIGCAMLNAPMAPVRSHLKAWAAKDYEGAYSYFSKELKDIQSLEEFTADAENLLIKSYSLNNVSIKSGSAVVKGTVTLEDGTKLGCRYKLIEKGKEWMIYGYKVSADVLFEEEDKGKSES